jgi:hypothetical protein
MPKEKTEMRAIQFWCPVENSNLGEYMTDIPDEALSEIITKMRKQYENQEIDYALDELENNVTDAGYSLEFIDPERYEF